MPEIGEVARIVDRLRHHLVGKTISRVHAVQDELVFKDITHTDFIKKMEGKKVIGAQQWGKYFWLVMDSPPHPVMHFGMTGWIDIKNDPAAHYRQTTIETRWPPKFLKFNLKVKEDDNEFAFVDTRRIGRVRLIDADAKNIRTTEPIASNGPDPVQEQIKESWLYPILRKKKLPVKALLLDQSILSGIGNWVADEILFNSRIHPETLTNTLSEDQMAALFKSVNYVTRTAVETNAEQERFPQDWLMTYRWNKGKGSGSVLPNGHKIEFLKVGGRTSAFVPALQKKGVNDTREDVGGIEAKPKKQGSRKRSVKGEEGEKKDENGDEEEPGEKVTKARAKKEMSSGKGKGRAKRVKVDEVDENEEEVEEPKLLSSKKRKSRAAAESGDAEKRSYAESTAKRVGVRSSARVRTTTFVAVSSKYTT